MAHRISMRELLHRATHRLPGVPAHLDHSPGHQSPAHHGQPTRKPAVHRQSLVHRWNHSPARPPRALIGWQTRIAALFGQELR